MGLGSVLKGALPFLGPIGSVIGAGVDYISGAHANQANAQNVDKQIAFQREQGNTQYQRAVKDMEAAGLNPALAYEKGGNATGAGAAATAQPITQNTGSKLASAIQSYNDIANAAAQRDLLREQASATAAQALKTQTEAAILAPEGILSQRIDWRDQFQKQRFAESRATEYGATREPARFEATLANLGAGTAKAIAETRNTRVNTTLSEQELQNAWYRDKLAPYVNSTAHALGLFRNIAPELKFNINKSSNTTHSPRFVEKQTNIMRH